MSKKNENTMQHTEDRIIDIDYEDEMKKSYIDYSMSVIVSRALPDVRDGFKPVHRRILYAMHELGLSPDKPFRKSARIVGDTMGKYHPHGDSSIYEAMVRMAQDYSLLVPLVEGHGNFGSIDGDSAAAMRYTEARLSKASMEVLKDLNRGVIDYKGNFDNSLKEPVVLPTKFPNLLVNGATGIAVGMKTDIPPHNLKEVINGCKAYLEDEDITTKGLMKYIKAPDFPTGGTIINKNDLLGIYEKGNGRIRVRAKIEVEDAGYGKSLVVITEIPYSFSGSKTKLIESLIEMVKDRKLDELSDVRDESNKDGIRIVLETKRNVNVDNLLAKLYSKTKLEDTISVNMLAIVDKKPEVLSLKDTIRHYIDFQREINIRKYNHILDASEKKKEVTEGLIKAHDVIDLIIEILRGSKDLKMAKNCLISGNTTDIAFKTKKSENEASKLKFSEVQANAVLDMKLHKLIGLELEKLKDELEKLKAEIEYCKKIINDREALNGLIKSELEEISKEYGAKRKTKVEEVEIVEVEEKFIEEEVYVLIDKFGYIKAVDEASYSRANEETLDSYKDIIKIKNTDKIIMFTEEGNLHQIRVLDIPALKIKDKGVLLDTISDVKKEKILLQTTYEEIKDRKILYTSKNGFMKIVEGSEFDTIRRTITATKLNDGDKVLEINLLDDEVEEIAVLSTDKKLLKFMASEVPTQKRMAVGVITMKLPIGVDLEKVILINKHDDEVKDSKEVKWVRKYKTMRRNSLGSYYK